MAKESKKDLDKRVRALEGQADTMKGTIDSLAKQNNFLVKEIDFGVYFVQALMGNIVSIFNMLKEEKVIDEPHHAELMECLNKFEGVCRNRFNEGKPLPGLTDGETSNEPTTAQEQTSAEKGPDVAPPSETSSESLIEA